MLGTCWYKGTFIIRRRLYWQGDSVNSIQLHAIDKVTLSISQNCTLLTGSVSQTCTLLTGSPCQQCIIDRDIINQSEGRDDAANRSISYIYCLPSVSNRWICFPTFAMVHSMRVASWFSSRPRLSDWKDHGKLSLHSVMDLRARNITWVGGGGIFLVVKL